MSTSQSSRLRPERRAISAVARVAAVVVIIGMLSSACTFGRPNGASSQTAAAAGVQPADLVKVVDQHGPVRVDGATGLPGTTGLLEAPHYWFGLRWLHHTDLISVEQNLQMRLTPNAATELRAAGGHEFVMAQMRQYVEGWPQIPGQPKPDVKAEIVVGDRPPVPLTRPPAGLDIILVSAPRGAPVLVRVIDEGRAQSIDLRTGKPVDVLAIYARPRIGYTTFGYKEPGTIRIAGISRQLTTSILAPTTGELSVRLEPWTPKGGWAAPGRAWLVAGGLTAFSDSIERNRDLALFYDLDAATSFTLLLPDGSRIAAQPDKIDAGTRTGEATRFYVSFDVPETFTAATLRLTPDGSVVGNRGKATWATRPPAKEFPLAITT
jgi:hypothetical protein